MKTKEYRLIPITEIPDEAREIAVAWIDNFHKIGGMEIQQKHKLASDIVNYAKEYAQTRWIPCSERLPEVKIDPNKDINDSTAVLGLLSNGEIYKMYLSHWYEDEPNSFNWRYSDCGELCDSVVMWTTLPPLPDSPNLKK